MTSAIRPVHVLTQKKNMRKYELICAFILALILMLLASCKRATAIESKSDSMAVSSVHVADSVFAMMAFLFDSLDVWYMDSVGGDSDVSVKGGRVVKHLAIRGGRLTNMMAETRQMSLHDSITFTEQEVIRPVTTPPKLPRVLVIVILVLILVFFGLKHK